MINGAHNTLISGKIAALNVAEVHLREANVIERQYHWIVNYFYLGI
ncbi:hypothetical protein tinsulaeT_03800 [Thalassotalea insulae]|uniref:Uncharacterized protein n=1 Tax=Thalassotalea insulae TaxID=2056778 RepID=A0ABQ6GM13_9GAMM|nr:hypothetical protein tinsulaeT_03800 [Thalassotalea insulae]